jgi:hypothetical protein
MTTIRKNLLRYKIAANKIDSPYILSQLQRWHGLAGDWVFTPVTPLSLSISATM